MQNLCVPRGFACDATFEHEAFDFGLVGELGRLGSRRAMLSGIKRGCAIASSCEILKAVDRPFPVPLNGILRNPEGAPGRYICLERLRWPEVGRYCGGSSWRVCAGILFAQAVHDEPDLLIDLFCLPFSQLQACLRTIYLISSFLAISLPILVGFIFLFSH